MATFVYVAKDRDGKVVEQSLQASHRYDALAEIRAMGLTVVSLNEVEALKGRKGKPAKRADIRKNKASSMFAPKIKAGEMAIFCRQLAISVTAGVALRDALESIVEDLENVTFRQTLKDVVSQLHEGSSFSGAIANYPKVFDELFVALIRAAEESGSMATTLTHISDSLDRRERLIRKIRGITAYPIFIGGFFILIGSVMTIFVLPKFEKSLTSIGGTLPTLTRVVFGINRFIMDNLPAIFVATLGLIAMFVLFSRTPSGRGHLDRVKLKIPLFGPCLKKIAIARFCQNLAIMVNGGVGITQAIEIAADIVGNSVLRNALIKARERIIAGSDISASLAEGGVFPSLVIRMVSVGEASGRLPEVLEQVSSAYEDQVEGEIVLVTALLEPILICFFGGFILILVLAIYLPVFTMSQGMT
jgi:type IV pilus assembly protein PilC